jgi:hypothetical protein
MFDDACCERAGQAIVQFASNTQDPRQYALKFFIAPEDYQAEANVYHNPALRTLLPRLEACIDNEDDVLVDPSGQRLPPCIIMERGESLDEWCHRHQPDMSAAVVVRSFSYTLYQTLALLLKYLMVLIANTNAEPDNQIR